MTALTAQRCLRHYDREAAARCPECREFFCRECISEHNGRVLCASCLARLNSPSLRSGGSLRWMRVLGRGLLAMAAFGMVWAVIYLGGRALLLMPTAFHDGTLWKEWQEISE
jgi:hypothetical protein